MYAIKLVRVGLKDPVGGLEGYVTKLGEATVSLAIGEESLRVFLQGRRKERVQTWAEKRAEGLKRTGLATGEYAEEKVI